MDIRLVEGKVYIGRPNRIERISGELYRSASRVKFVSRFVVLCDDFGNQHRFSRVRYDMQSDVWTLQYAPQGE